MPEWMTTVDAATELDYSVEYVRRLIRDGRLSAIKYGHIWLVYPDSVYELKEILAKQIREGYSKFDPRRGA